MTKEIALKRHENDANDWRKMSIKHAIETAEGQRQLAEQLAPIITIHLPGIQQFVRDMNIIAQGINEAMEPYRQLGRHMTHAIREYNRQAEQIGKAMRIFLQPNLDRINREIARRNAIVVEPASSSITSEVVTTTSIQVKHPKNWLPYQLEDSTLLCPCVAVHFERKTILFQHQDGWAWENLEPLQRQILELLWRKSQRGDRMGYSTKELGQRCKNDNDMQRSSGSICNRIKDINDLSTKYGYMNLIVSDNRKRKFNSLLRQML